MGPWGRFGQGSKWNLHLHLGGPGQPKPQDGGLQAVCHGKGSHGARGPGSAGRKVATSGGLRSTQQDPVPWVQAASASKAWVFRNLFPRAVSSHA